MLGPSLRPAGESRLNLKFLQVLHIDLLIGPASEAGAESDHRIG